MHALMSCRQKLYTPTRINVRDALVNSYCDDVAKKWYGCWRRRAREEERRCSNNDTSETSRVEHAWIKLL